MKNAIAKAGGSWKTIEKLYVSLKCLAPELNPGTSARSKDGMYGELSIWEWDS